jgi:uncharacterized repeat protein (TIGR03803 family)
MKPACFVCLFLCITITFAARPAQAETESILLSFNCGTVGCYPYAGLVLDKKGNLYGTTQFGGSFSLGTVFELTPKGVETVLHSFVNDGTDGYAPVAVVLDSKGNLYGTTYAGGAGDRGTVFKVTPSGTETVLYSFTCQTGCSPYAGVVLDPKGNLYGTTNSGGASGVGTVFKLTPTGKLTTLHNFCAVSNCTDGESPVGGVVLDKADNLYGTTYYGGASGFGTVFKVTPSGTESVLHNFDGNGEDGFYPEAGVILDSKDNVYGTTSMGGKIGVGTVFEVTASGTETILHSFTAGADGFTPYAGLVFDEKGNLYGTTEYGGSSGLGTVFELTPKGVETVLHSFVRNGTDGYFPYSGSLFIDASGDLYGTTFEGGSGSSSFCGTVGCGTAFKIVP